MSLREHVFITADQLARRLDAGEQITLLDVRWSLPEPDGVAAYEAGHLPGAVYVSLDDELTDHTVPGRGRHPLPSGRPLQVAARRWG
ncbi:MAG: rhodanese-like domain-containing protein, partial [Mycobacterium sp.]